MEIMVVPKLIDVGPTLDGKFDGVLNARVARIIKNCPLHGLFEPLHHRMCFREEVRIEILSGQLLGGLICLYYPLGKEGIGLVMPRKIELKQLSRP